MEALMLDLKKTAIAVFVLGSSVAFAGEMGAACAPGDITVPCKKTAVDIAGRALYLQPLYDIDSGGGRESGVITGMNNINGPRQDMTYNQHNVNYQWGFMVEGSFHYHAGDDISLNWYRLHAQNNYQQPIHNPSRVGCSEFRIWKTHGLG
jgi:hypothetical protein